MNFTGFASGSRGLARCGWTLGPTDSDAWRWFVFFSLMATVRFSTESDLLCWGIVSHRIHGAGIDANIKGVYWWDINVTMYSSTMDPSWGLPFNPLKPPFLCSLNPRQLMASHSPLGWTPWSVFSREATASGRRSIWRIWWFNGMINWDLMGFHRDLVKFNGI